MTSGDNHSLTQANPMYEMMQEITLSSGSASYFPNNLSVFYHTNKQLTYACIAHKNQVCIYQLQSKICLFIYLE